VDNLAKAVRARANQVSNQVSLASRASQVSRAGRNPISRGGRAKAVKRAKRDKNPVRKNNLQKTLRAQPAAGLFFA
jgi:hypothetical protein